MASEPVIDIDKEHFIADRVRLNHQIRARDVRLIDENGDQIGVVTLQEALAKAEAAELDLVEISPQAKPPVVKIIDWGKFQYEKTKQAQQAKKKQKAQELKQMRFGLKIGQHDLDVKLKRVRGFIEKGSKVKLTVFFRGREIVHKELGYQLLDRAMESLDDIAVVDSPPSLTGKHLNMTIRKK